MEGEMLVPRLRRRAGQNLSTKRQWIAELARRKPGTVLFSLHHVIDLE
jgi:hypothetical protein